MQRLMQWLMRWQMAKGKWQRLMTKVNAKGLKKMTKDSDEANAKAQANCIKKIMLLLKDCKKM